jgi:pimeloyl-ACP methyl ester carboxylesterase
MEFVLVHGAWHGAWAWDLVLPALRGAGHTAVAVDLPVDNLAVDASGYAAAIAASIERAGLRSPVVVGHSLSGMAIPLVPVLAPVGALVYLGALVPSPGETMSAVFAREGVRGDVRPFMDADGDGRSRWATAEGAIRILYHDCGETVARAAAARLRAQSPAPFDEPCPLERFPDVPATYVLMREDRMILPEWSRRAAPARLGLEPVEIGGGHSPMLADPEGLTALLVRLAGQAPVDSARRRRK